MSDTLGTQPLVNGATVTVNGVVVQTTVSGTVAIIPVYELWQSGALVGSSNQLNVQDPNALISLGSVVTTNVEIINNTSSVISQLTTVITNTGEIATELATVVSNTGSTVTELGTVISNGNSTVANTGSAVTELGIISTKLSGTLKVSPSPSLAYTVSQTSTVGETSGLLFNCSTLTACLVITTLPTSTSNVWICPVNNGTAVINSGIPVFAGGGQVAFGSPDLPLPTGSIYAITDGGSSQVVTLVGG